MFIFLGTTKLKYLEFKKNLETKVIVTNIAKRDGEKKMDFTFYLAAIQRSAFVRKSIEYLQNKTLLILQIFSEYFLIKNLLYVELILGVI